MKSGKLTNILALYILIGAAAAAALWFLAISPLYRGASDATQKLAALNTQIDGLNQLDKDTQTLKRNYEAVKSKRDQVLHLLPEESEEENLLALLSDLAAQSGVTLSAFAPQLPNGNAVAPASLSLYPASITVTGLYTNVQAFLTKVENAARFVNVESTGFTGASGSGVDGRISITAYYRGPSSAGGIQ